MLVKNEHDFWVRTETIDDSEFQHIYSKNHYRLPDRFDPGDLIIDVGTHIGSFLFACKARGLLHGIGFEPHPENHRIARMNLPGFTIHQAAVWRSDRGPTVLQHSGFGFNTGSGGVMENRTYTPVLVNAIPLDDILRAYKRVRLLKLDCEGAEYPILMTCHELGRVQEIVGEYHSYSHLHYPDFARVNGQDTYTGGPLLACLEKQGFETRRWGFTKGRTGLFSAKKK